MDKIKELGMTEQQAVEEILTMREFSNFLEDKLGEETYQKYVNEFARYFTETQMRVSGVSEDDIKEVCDNVDKMFS